MNTKRKPNPIHAPWHIDMRGDEYDLAGTDIVISDNQGNVAALTNNDNANHARLIAAAPDLLRVAKEVIDAWEHGDLAAAVRDLACAVEEAEG